MKNERMFKSMIAKYLVLAMSISFVPGNVLAQSRNSPMLKAQVIATPSNAVEFIGEEEEVEEVEIADNDDLATDSNAKGKIPVENLFLLTNPVPYEEITLDGREFSTIVADNVVPYYHVIKYTVPEGESGHYTIDAEYIDCSYGSFTFYICNEEQYETICNKIETKGYPVYASAPTECLAYNSYGSLSYRLEEGQDYYIISAGNSDKVGDYKIDFERDITVTFVASDADQPGTVAVYSKGGKWIEMGGWYSALRKVNRPQKDGFKFAGYFTEENGQGIKVIDYDGEILAEMSELNNDTTVYAHWESFSPVEYEDILLLDGRYSVTCIAENAPYYKVFRFKVPEKGDGYYTLYHSSDKDLSMYGYLCDSDQYKELCRKIEADGCAQWFPNPENYYVSYSPILNVCRKLESGQEYFFVAARGSKKDYGEGEYQLLFRRDIEVKLDAGEAEYQGTSALFSSGNRWNKDDDRRWETDDIVTPRREGYLFAGYFTKKNGQGNKVIDQEGYIYHEDMHELKNNTTIYALWEDKNHEHTITINEPTHSDSDEEHLGTWTMDETGNWRYYSSGSNYYSNEWKYLKYNGTSHWYYLGSDGYVKTGWFADNTGKWYYLNPVSNGTKGAMQTGWLTDPLDGNRYYLDPQTGQMAIGWVNVDGVWYYFTESEGEYSGWKWDAVTGAWQYENIGRRSTGALEPDKKRN